MTIRQRYRWVALCVGLFALLLALLPMRPSAQDYGSNWTLSYYTSQDLSGTVASTATAPRLDFDFGAGQPAVPTSIDVNSFSLRAQSQLTFEEGTYRFSAGSDDGVRVFIDGITVINAFSPRSFGFSTAEVFVSGGGHNVVVEYFNNSGDARLQVYWERISAGNLATPPATAAPTATPAPPTLPPLPGGQVASGEVIGATGLTVRTGPYLGASRIGIIEPNDIFPVYARNTSEGEFNWYYIYIQRTIFLVDEASGETYEQVRGTPYFGWVSGRYFVPDKPVNQIPLAASVFETLNAPSSTGVQGVLRSNMRLRQLPSYRTPTLAILDWGAEVEIVGRTLQARQNHWLQVYYTAPNGERILGWLFAPFITINGDINNVPTY